MTTPARQAALKAFRDYITDDCDGTAPGQWLPQITRRPIDD